MSVNNFGFISKKRVAREIAKIYNEHERDVLYPELYAKEMFLQDCAVQSALNMLCKRLRIVPIIPCRTKKMDNNDNGLCCSAKWFNAPHQKCR